LPCFFIRHLYGILISLNFEMPDNRGKISLEDIFYLAEIFFIILGCLKCFTWAFAITQVIFQANFEFPL
ncbi:MAG TPA: hypothetical protein VN922_11790, partial [Bacteroidia bacterium]|nr:hypothetical protein [Bacteroidia bacterium]